MRWPWHRHRRPPPQASEAAQHARQEAEEAVERQAGVAARMREEVQQLREHRSANQFDRLLTQTYHRRPT